MGLFDSVKKMLGNSGVQQQIVPDVVEVESDNDDGDTDDDGGGEYDIAGFDPDDEIAFFDALSAIESEGPGGSNEQKRAKTMARYGLRDHLHWQDVRDAMYHTLARKFGSFDAVMQAQLNHQSGQGMNQVAASIAAKQASGDLAPVFGISLESWAAINAAISGGANFDDLLKGAGIDRARWDKASAEWMARMSRDTTFAVSTVYGNAFQAASTGRFGNLSREATAARMANVELTSPLPMTIDQYFEVMMDQTYAAAAGKSATDALKSHGLTLVDFCDLSSFMGYYMDRTNVGNHERYYASMMNAEAKAKAKYPGTTADVDISF
jgi:hypothetical protein